MTTTPVSAVHYGVSRLTIAVGSTPGEFQARYEQAVPPFPAEQITDLVRRQAPWQDMLDLMTATAPLGFCLFYKNDVNPVVHLAGDRATGVSYLMNYGLPDHARQRYVPDTTHVRTSPARVGDNPRRSGPGCPHQVPQLSRRP